MFNWCSEHFHARHCGASKSREKHFVRECERKTAGMREAALREGAAGRLQVTAAPVSRVFTQVAAPSLSQRSAQQANFGRNQLESVANARQIAPKRVGGAGGDAAGPRTGRFGPGPAHREGPFKVDSLPVPRVDPRRLSAVVVDVVDFSVEITAQLPSVGQGNLSVASSPHGSHWKSIQTAATALTSYTDCAMLNTSLSWVCVTSAPTHARRPISARMPHRRNAATINITQPWSNLNDFYLECSQRTNEHQRRRRRRDDVRRRAAFSARRARPNHVYIIYLRMCTSCTRRTCWFLRMACV